MTGIRLVVCDMDGTLLLDDGAIPDAFWPLLAQMTARTSAWWSAGPTGRWSSGPTGRWSSGPWIDIMSRQADKGVGVRVLQRNLAVGPEQTAAFGDYLNDLEMLAAAQHSFAVANAHPAVAAAAGVQIPSNVEQGVITTLRELLADGEGPTSPVPDQ
ncbi:HAD family hydrolase [Gordonia crocea]|uniref:Hydrolase n=1 Tax=Gordonia crocea TaxID=589162 RepID=A0A7I9V0F6_9ACTN|nr:HAD hydrolase family protein [Gordonia crocea]GED98855.1 hypothetical protein nbrc107697_28940 [Gordonia crocea]